MPSLHHHGRQSPGPGDPTKCFILCLLGHGVFYHSSREGARTDEDVGRVQTKQKQSSWLLVPWLSGIQFYEKTWVQLHDPGATENWSPTGKIPLYPFWKCTSSHSELSPRKTVREAYQTVNISRTKIVIKTAPNIRERRTTTQGLKNRVKWVGGRRRRERKNIFPPLAEELWQLKFPGRGIQFSLGS